MSWGSSAGGVAVALAASWQHRLPHRKGALPGVAPFWRDETLWIGASRVNAGISPLFPLCVHGALPHQPVSPRITLCKRWASALPASHNWLEGARRERERETKLVCRCYQRLCALVVFVCATARRGVASLATRWPHKPFVVAGCGWLWVARCAVTPCPPARKILQVGDGSGGGFGPWGSPSVTSPFFLGHLATVPGWYVCAFQIRLQVRLAG